MRRSLPWLVLGSFALSCAGTPPRPEPAEAPVLTAASEQDVASTLAPLEPFGAPDGSVRAWGTDGFVVAAFDLSKEADPSTALATFEAELASAARGEAGDDSAAPWRQISRALVSGDTPRTFSPRRDEVSIDGARVPRLIYDLTKEDGTRIARATALLSRTARGPWLFVCSAGTENPDILATCDGLVAAFHVRGAPAAGPDGQVVLGQPMTAPEGCAVDSNQGMNVLVCQDAMFMWSPLPEEMAQQIGPAMMEQLGFDPAELQDGQCSAFGRPIACRHMDFEVKGNEGSALFGHVSEGPESWFVACIVRGGSTGEICRGRLELR